MAHYNVLFSCGHEQRIELFGKQKDRTKTIEYFEQYGVCSMCYQERKAIEMTINFDEIRMPYRTYKLDYAGCKTKPGSYDGISKTIIVYVPKSSKEEK